ncbi:MAG TPA: apolipoprotein N-acyltransferase [Rhizomicrobium sp.]|jgi:apolipoprotein N-acyltransferase
MNRLVAIGAFVRALEGWRRALFAFAAGLLSVLAFAPFGLFVFLLLGFASLVLLIDGAQGHRHPIRSAAFASWMFGFGLFAGGLYWIAYAFLVDAAEHAWQIPFAVGILAAGMALYGAGAAAASAALWRPGASRILLLAAFYAIGEWLRGHLLTGFPWNLPAYAWGASLSVMQSNALFGAYGMTLLTVLLGASLACLADRSWRFPAAMATLFVVLWIGGDIRLALSTDTFVPNVRLRVVQPDIPQDEKFPLQYRDRNWRSLMQMSVGGNAPAPTLVIWPESAPPFLLDGQPAALDDISLMTTRGSTLITGAVRVEPGEDRARFFNSLYVFASGQRVATFDKFHLVPFGEYLPLESFFRVLGIDKLVDSPGNFTAGPGPRTLDIPGAPPASPLICYEVLFPGAVVSGARRPGWIVNVTDDSWFGPPSSTGPRQHFLSARVRAIEEGLPIIRSANTGISAIIDGNGRVLGSLAPGEKGVIDGYLPQELHPTLYARLGDIVFVLMLLGCFAIAFAFCRHTTVA